MAAMKFWAIAAGAILISGAANAQTAPLPPGQDPSTAANAAPSSAPAAATPKVQGYLDKTHIPNAIAILPPPPARGSAGDKQDEDAFKATRKLMGTPRWALATRDATQYFGAFECPLGLSVSAWPKTLTTLLLRVGRDASVLTNLAKDHFDHPRPFITYGGPICTEDDRAGLMKSYSYPSGHTTFSWAVGLILAEMAPDRAAEILGRARAFGESRVVCGVHTVSDVQEGRTNGAVLVAMLHADPDFQADLATAKAALREAMASPHPEPDPGQCKIEVDAAAHTPWINPTTDK